MAAEPASKGRQLAVVTLRPGWEAIFRSRSSAHSLEPCQSRRASEVPGDEAPQALASRLALDEPKALCNAVDGGSSNVGALAILAIVAAVPVALVSL